MNVDLKRKPNHLKNETSPYLLQHIYNPVDWYPWSKEAFQKAKDEKKPIFLSIGYSTCHWCHVMAHESFENKETSLYLNEHFVSIKLDREERPDLDQIYQNVIQMMGRRGGWPLSIFMTPDKKPFFAGTYFPNERKYGMRSFREILENIVELYENRHHDVTHTANQIFRALSSISEKLSDSDENEIPIDILEHSMISLESSFDSTNGGFGSAPKFPNFPTLLFLIRQIAEYSLTNPNKYLNIKKELEHTLDQMAAGGIFDHVGGGFARYSVDSQWIIPHFEKMLYDNALALQVYSEAYFLFQKNLYKEIVRKTVDYVLRDMYLTDVGFYSALDADSEGEEGKYYVWKKSELEEIITSEKKDLFYEAYGVSDGGNFENSTNHLHLINQELAFENKNEFAKIFSTLLKIRNNRIPPSLDNKILTSWSSLMVKGLYSAYRILDDIKLKNIAHNVLESLKKYQFSSEEKVLYRVLDENTKNHKIPGHLDDYAYFIQALFDDFLYFPKSSTLNLIKLLIEIVQEQFWDSSSHGFFYSSSLNKDLLARLKTGSDMPLPNPNSIMAENLIQYHNYISDAENLLYLEQAKKSLLPYIDAAISYPTNYGALLLSIQWYLNGSIDLVITNEQKHSDEIFQLINSYYIPRLHLLYKKQTLEDMRSLSIKMRLDSKYYYYFCLHFNCLPPTKSWEGFIQLLNQNLIKISRDP